MPDAKKKRKAFDEMLCEKLNIPLSVIDLPSIDIVGRTQILVCGCYTIDKYSDDSIELTTGMYRTKIHGECLSLLTYMNGKIEISGKIHSVHFFDRGGC